MSEKRFQKVQDPRVQTEYFIYDNENKISRNITDYPFDNEDVCSRIVMLLNEQQATIEQLEKDKAILKERLEKINGGYGHLTHRNGLTANEWLIESQERELKKKKEQISDWIEQHSKDIEKISEQQATISDLKDENEQLKEERNYFERKKCEYFNKYNKKHLDNIQLKEENEQLKKARDESDKFIAKKGLGAEFLNWCVAND